MSRCLENKNEISQIVDRNIASVLTSTLIEIEKTNLASSRYIIEKEKSTKCPIIV